VNRLKLPSKIQFADAKVKKAVEKLETASRSELHTHLIRAFKTIEKDAFCCTQIPKKLIPKEYLKKYGVSNLWKYDLPNAWRLIYSIESEKVIVISIILEWMDHKTYERKFKY